MKALFVLLTVLLIGCSNDEPKISANSIEGTWLLTRITGGIAGINKTTEKGDERIMVLSQDGSFYFENNGVKTETGKYKLNKKNSMLFNKEVKFIEFTEGNEFMYELNKDMLLLSQDYYDGFNYEYQRIK